MAGPDLSALANLTPDQISALQQAAAQPGGAAYLAALASQQTTELAGLNAGGGSAAAAGSPTSSQFTLGQDAITQVQNMYPDLAWLLNIPDVGPLIVKAAQQGTDPTAFVAQFKSTPWYQTHSDAVQKWIQEVYTDPAQATADLQAQESTIYGTVASLGVGALPQQITWLAQQSLALGWSDQQIKDQIAHDTKFVNGQPVLSMQGITAGAPSKPGSLLGDIQSIHAEAGKYLVPISDSTAQSFATSMANGTMDATGVDAYLQAQAESLYPSIAGAIKSGTTVADYVTPYKEVAAQLLGVDPASINMMQSKWNRAITQPGPDGKPQAMTLYDWQQLLMSDKQYNYLGSINAKDRASSIAQGIAEMFGKAPSGPAGSTAFAAAGAPRIAGVPIT